MLEVNLSSHVPVQTQIAYQEALARSKAAGSNVDRRVLTMTEDEFISVHRGIPIQTALAAYEANRRLAYEAGLFSN